MRLIYGQCSTALMCLLFSVVGCSSRDGRGKYELEIPVPDGAINIQRSSALGIGDRAEFLVAFQIRTEEKSYAVYDFYDKFFERNGLKNCINASKDERRWRAFLDSSRKSVREMHQLAARFHGRGQFVEVLIEGEQSLSNSKEPSFFQTIAVQLSMGHVDSCDPKG